jgi:hypothetical protein
VAGNAEERLDLRLLGGGQGGDGAAEAFVASGHEHVPRERIDRGAAHHPDALEILVHRRHELQIDADDEDHGRGGDGLGQARGRRGALDGGGIDSRRVDGVPRVFAVLDLGGIALGG